MLRAVTPEPDFLEFLDTFNEHESHADKPSLRPSSILERPTSSTHRRHLPASCSSQSRVHQPLVGLQGFLDLLPPGPEDQSPPRIPTPRKLYPSAEREHIQLFEGARDLLEPLLDSPPAQLLRPRDDVAVDPLEPLLDVSYQGAQGQLRELQGSSSSVTPVPVAHGCTSCTNTRSPDLSSSNSQLEEDKLSLVMQKLVDIKQRLDSLPASSKGQRKRQATGLQEDDARIPAPRTQRSSSPRSAQDNGSVSSRSGASAISEQTGMPARLDMQPSQDFRRQLFKGIAIQPMWDKLGPLPIAVIYDSTFASNWDVQLPLRHLQRHVTIGQIVELSPVAWGQLVTGIVTKLVNLAPSCLDPNTTRSQHFASLATEATVVYGIFGVVNPRDILALFGCHLSSPEQKDRARPWSKALARARFTDVQVSQTRQLWTAFDTRMARLSTRRQQLLELIQHQEAHNHPAHAISMAPAMIEPATELMANVRLQQEVLLHTMRAFLYGICDPWQWGHMLAFNYPYHIETMDLIQFIQTL